MRQYFLIIRYKYNEKEFSNLIQGQSIIYNTNILAIDNNLVKIL